MQRAAPPPAQIAPAASAPGAGQAPLSDEPFSIPSGYGEDRLVLMVKDPWWLFAYWEVQPSTERAARSRLLPQEVAGLQSIIRVYDVTGLEDAAPPARAAFDIRLSGLATNWYIQVNAPGRSFLAEIGLLTTGGRFLPLVRSNRVTTPRFGPSDIIDEEWVITDEAYWKLLGSLASLGPGSSQVEWSRLTAKAPSSGSLGSAGLSAQGRPAAARSFWCRVSTDLVIHGATEPRAAVTIQDLPVPVRKDGTFSLRLTLPVGTQTIAIEVTSADGRRVKTVTPIVALGWSGALAPDASITYERWCSPAGNPAAPARAPAGRNPERPPPQAGGAEGSKQRSVSQPVP